MGNFCLKYQFNFIRVGYHLLWYICGGGTEETRETESISLFPLSTVIVGVPSVVESDKFPATEVAPLSRSELTLTPESALQLPRSPKMKNTIKFYLICKCKLIITESRNYFEI